MSTLINSSRERKARDENQPVLRVVHAASPISPRTTSETLGRIVEAVALVVMSVGPWVVAALLFVPGLADRL